MNKPTLYFDMDNVLVDFPSAFEHIDPALLAQHEHNKDEITGIFSLMKPVDGALEAVHALAPHFDVYVLSTAPWDNPSAWSDKLLWIKKYFGSEPGSVFYKK